MAFNFNSTTDAKSAIPHSVSLNPHSCVGRMKEPAYLARFKQGTRTVLDSERFPGQDTDSKSLLNSVAASVAVRRNAMELKFLESALNALRLKEKKALRNLENEMKKYRLELDKMPRSLTSRLNGIAPPIVNDEVLLKRIGKNRKLRVAIAHSTKEEKLPDFSKEKSLKATADVAENSDKENAANKEKHDVRQETHRREETAAVTEDKMHEKKMNVPDTTHIQREECGEGSVDPGWTERVASNSKLPPRRTSAKYRLMRSPTNLTLTDNIARTCSEYFSLLKIINEHHQAATTNSSTLPPVGGVEQQRSLAVIEPTRCQSPRTIRLKEAGTQFDKRYVIVRDDVVEDKEMWPSWWTPNNKPVQTEDVGQGPNEKRTTTQSWPPFQSFQPLGSTTRVVCEEVDLPLSDREDQRTKQKHRNYPRKEGKKNKKIHARATTAKARPRQTTRAKSRAKVKQQAASTSSDSSSSSQSPRPTYRSQRGVFLTQSSDETSSTEEVGVSTRNTQSDERNRTPKRASSKHFKWRKAQRKHSVPVKQIPNEEYTHYPGPPLHYPIPPGHVSCETHKPQSSHNLNIKAQFQCNGYHGPYYPCPSQQCVGPSSQTRITAGRNSNVFRKPTPVVTPTETVKLTTRNSTSGFSSFEAEERRLSANVASPVDHSPITSLPESLKLQHDPSLRKSSITSSGSRKPIASFKAFAGAQQSVDAEKSNSSLRNTMEESKDVETVATNTENIIPSSVAAMTASRIQTTDSRTQTSRRNSLDNENHCSKYGRNESHTSFTRGMAKPMSARVVPSLQSQFENPVFRIELCAITEDQESIAQEGQPSGDSESRGNVFRFRNPTRNGRVPKKYQVVLNDLSQLPVDDKPTKNSPVLPQVSQSPSKTVQNPVYVSSSQPHQVSPPTPPSKIPQSVHRWQSDMVADNVFNREPLPASGWCHNSQSRKFIPAQCIEPLLATHTPNVQRFEAPDTAKSTVPPSTAMVRGEECSDFLQSNSCLSGDFATRWRHGGKSRCMSGFTSTAGRRSILKPVYEDDVVCQGDDDDNECYYDSINPPLNDYKERTFRPATAAHFRQSVVLSPECERRYEMNNYDPNHEFIEYEESTPKHTFLFEGSTPRHLANTHLEAACIRTPQEVEDFVRDHLPLNLNTILDKEPTFAEAKYQISKNRNLSKAFNVIVDKPLTETSLKDPRQDSTFAKHKVENTDKSAIKDKVWKIKSPRRQPVWKRKRVDSSSSFRQLYNMHEYSLTADQRDQGLGLTSCSSGAIERMRRNSITSSGELRFQQALALERSTQLELQTKIKDFSRRLSNSKGSTEPSSEMREISTRGTSVGRKRRKQ